MDAEHLELLPQQRGGLLREGWPSLAQIGGLALADAQVLNIVVPVAPVPNRISNLPCEIKSNQISGAAQNFKSAVPTTHGVNAAPSRGSRERAREGKRGQGWRVTGDEPAGSGKERGAAGRRAAGG